ncbi:MAG TPA: hypothetical protein VFK41_04780 [Nocardioidaceae bacterium]|nr:hypothetical protein [Nocardioidaceae bacterium]
MAATRLKDEPRTVDRSAGDLRFLWGALALTTLLRLEGLLWPLKPDESGFLLVSRQWDATSDSLYGALFVDRPPILIGLFRLCDVVGGPYAPRVASGLLGLLFVYSAYRIGLLLGGTSSARWTTAAAVALAGQPDLELWAGKSESLGMPLVLASCWLSLEALTATRRNAAYALAAGLTGALAVGMKQNLGGGAVFGIVLLAVALGTHQLDRSRGLRLGSAAAAGFLVPVAGVVAWAAASGVELHVLWDTLYGFRGDAFEVITSSSADAPLSRLASLGVLFTTSGLAFLLVWFACCFATVRRSQAAAAAATAAMLLVDSVGLLLGGSYWTPYLTALLPGAVIAVALVVGQPSGRAPRGMRIVTGVAVASTVITTIGWTAGHLLGRTAPDAHYVGTAVGAAAAPGDTIVVLYGRADIVLASGLDPVYEHLWSLPARTLDPELDGLRALLASNQAPTWVVEWNPVNSWEIDRDGRLQALLEQEYDVAAEVCGAQVLLRRGEARDALPSVDCDRAWR